MTLRDICVAFGYEVDAASERRAESSIKGISNMAKKLLGAITVYFSIQGLSSLAQAAADVEALESQFTQVFGDMEAEATKSLQAIADESGALANRMKGSFTQIAAFTKTTGATEEEALGIAERGMYAVADSAAFYDRSLEDVTASLQSFLKGNFEQDAALGLSCTETTRNAAANKLYGKSFKELSEYQKQLTLLSMVEDANKMSGALGQAARESDTWTNQLGNLKQSLQDLKASAGAVILKPAISALKILTALVQKATKAVQGLTKENGLLTRATERYHALVKKLEPSIRRMAETMNKGMAKAKDMVKTVVDRLGGVGNAVKLLSTLVAAFIVYLKWDKVMKGITLFKSLFSTIGKAFSLASLKIIAIIAAVIALFLVVEDFYHFLMGNNSLIGKLFDEAGIGADNARKKIFDAWKKVKVFLLNVWDVIKRIAKLYVDTYVNFFVSHLDSIVANFKRAWGIVQTFLEGVWTFISEVATAIFGGTEESINGSQMSTQDKIVSVWKYVLDVLTAVWDAIYEVADAVFNALATVIETVFGWIQAFWEQWGDRIVVFFKAVWDSTIKIIGGFLDVIKGLANFISAVFKGDWEGAWNAIKDIFVGIWDIITGFLERNWETFKLIFEIGLAAIKAVWEVVWGGIKSFFVGIFNGILSFFEGIVNAIKAVIEPIAKFFTGVFETAWKGIKNVFSGVKSFFEGVFGGIVEVFRNVGTVVSDTISGAVKSAINGVLSGAIGIINGFISAINAVIGVINAIPGVEIGKLDKLDVPQLAEGGIATAATSAIIGEGAEPEAVMPLSKLGAMISGYIKEAKESEAVANAKTMIKDVASFLKDGVASLSGAATASPTTASNTTTNNNSNVVQNVEINNSYSGGDRETQKNMSNAMKKSAVDATTLMARSLAYARG